MKKISILLLLLITSLRADDVVPTLFHKSDKGLNPVTLARPTYLRVSDPMITNVNSWPQVAFGPGFIVKKGLGKSAGSLERMNHKAIKTETPKVEYNTVSGVRYISKRWSVYSFTYECALRSTIAVDNVYGALQFKNKDGRYWAYTVFIDRLEGGKGRTIKFTFSVPQEIYEDAELDDFYIFRDGQVYTCYDLDVYVSILYPH